MISRTVAALAPLLILGCSRRAAIDTEVSDAAAIHPGIRTARASSYDRTGGNRDCTPIEPGATLELGRMEGAGAIRHLYIGTTTPARVMLREMVLRMYWDGGAAPCVESPLGDFFLNAYEAWVRPVDSRYVVIQPGMTGAGSNGYHSWFPMPFARGARITVENQAAQRSHQLCYHLEFETYDGELPADLGRFHAQWRRETTDAGHAAQDRNKVQWPGVNRDGARNYVILEAEGSGHLAGLALSIDNRQPGWYGEGDDMIFIDGERWPPSYHGTGTEEIFGGGATPNSAYIGPHTGILFAENRGGRNFAGKVSMYRWFDRDPVRFSKSVRWTLEHGHANNFDNDYTSLAYWYQTEPHKPFPVLRPARDRIPSMPDDYTLSRAMIFATQDDLPRLGAFPAPRRDKLREMRREGYRLFHEGRWKESREVFERHAREAKR